jgi:hypothetical protein
MTTTATPPLATIEVLKLVAFDKGSLKAMASVRIGPSPVVHKCRVIQQPGPRAWVSMPQERFGGPNRARTLWLIVAFGDMVYAV